MSFKNGKFKFTDMEREIKYSEDFDEIYKYLENCGIMEVTYYAFDEHTDLAVFHKIISSNTDFSCYDDLEDEELCHDDLEDDVDKYFVTTYFNDDWQRDIYNRLLEYNISDFGGEELFDLYGNILPEYIEYINIWKLKYAVNETLESEDSETLFIFDCSECSYEFLDKLGIIENSVFYVLNGKLYSLIFAMFY